MSRRLIIDCQIFQTPAWHRGMGKYSLELLKALAKSKELRGWSHIDVVLSKNLKTNKDAMRELGGIKEISIVELDIDANNIRDPKIAANNRETIDAYVEILKEKPQEIDFLIMSLMQGEIFPVYPTANAVCKFLLFYDLIPVMFHDVYLESPLARAGYLPKIAELLKADKYFTISKTVANDLSLYLGINKARIINIDGGPINHSTETKPIDVPEPFILMPTGNDPRKNNRKGIKGFNEFNKLQAGKYTLVITSFFKESEKKELKKLFANLYFTDNVSGKELSYLYEKSTALLFPSEYEGLGLPILEAVEKDKPIACSNISVFQEISQTAFHYFEPKSVLGIERALNKLIASPQTDKKTYQSILKKYTWASTVSRMASSMLEFSKPIEQPPKRPLVIFSPDPSSDSVCARQVQDSHGELSRLFDVTYYFAGSKGKRRVNYLPHVTKTHKISSRLAFAPQDQLPVYHLSNDAACSKVLLCALAVPGIVLLYDMQLDKAWKALMGEKLVSKQRFELEKQIDAENHTEGALLLTSLVNNQRAVVVFNEPRQEILKKLTKQINSTTSIRTVDVPLGELVYTDANPNRTINVGEFYKGTLATGDRRLNTKIDVQYDGALSRMKTVIFDQPSLTYDILSAMRFGAIPIIPRGTESADVFGESALRYRTVEAAKKTAQELISGKRQTGIITGKIAKVLMTQSVERFTHQLQTIIMETKE
jgi:hypothetical protein